MSATANDEYSIVRTVFEDSVGVATASSPDLTANSVSASATMDHRPTAIPLYDEDVLDKDSPIPQNVSDGGIRNDVEDYESDYSYTYEEEDETHFSGFLISTEPLEPTNSRSSNGVISRERATIGGAVSCNPTTDGSAVLVDTDSEENVGRSFRSERNDRVPINGTASQSAPFADGDDSSGVPLSATTKPASDEASKLLQKQKWRAPTREAVTMSLRAEKETSGGRRRLASDIYKIMMTDTSEAGFSVEPCETDSMEKWCIKLFRFDPDSNLAKDLLVLNTKYVELEMTFPEQYPFEPPFVRVIRPRFKRQTGFVMNGALCMELLMKDGWNPINDIESVIVSIRSLMVVGDGRLQAAAEMEEEKYQLALEKALKTCGENAEESNTVDGEDGGEDDEEDCHNCNRKRTLSNNMKNDQTTSKEPKSSIGSYTSAEASAAYDHLMRYHQEKGWDKSGWWAKRG